jgi:hypothetical protein
MLQDFLIPQLDEDYQEGPINFHQDGTPPHSLAEALEYLITSFPGRWIGRARLTAWFDPWNLNP